MSIGSMLLKHTLFQGFGIMCGIGIVGYTITSIYANNKLNKAIKITPFYQQKIHKEIAQIISDSVEKKEYGRKEIKTFEPNYEWNLNLANKDLLNSIDKLKNNYYKVQIETSKYPYDRYIIINHDDKLNKIKISFND